MLERKSNDMLVSFEWGRAIGAREPFCNDNFDSTLRIPSIPMFLLQYLRMKWRESNAVLVSISVKICFNCENLKSKKGREKEPHTRAQICQMNVSSYSIKQQDRGMKDEYRRGVISRSLEVRSDDVSDDVNARNLPIICGQIVLCP